MFGLFDANKKKIHNPKIITKIDDTMPIENIISVRDTAHAKNYEYIYDLLNNENVLSFNWNFYFLNKNGELIKFASKYFWKSFWDDIRDIRYQSYINPETGGHQLSGIILDQKGYFDPKLNALNHNQYERLVQKKPWKLSYVSKFFYSLTGDTTLDSGECDGKKEGAHVTLIAPQPEVYLPPDETETLFGDLLYDTKDHGKDEQKSRQYFYLGTIVEAGTYHQKNGRLRFGMLKFGRAPLSACQKLIDAYRKIEQTEQRCVFPQ